MRRLLASCLCLLAVAAPAYADGDPASDWLPQPGFEVYYPYNPQLTASQKQALNDVATQVTKGGVQLKAAIIATDGDLGAVPQLFAKPQQYADFLAAELRFIYKGSLLIVMPNGYALHTTDPKLRAPLARLPRLGASGDPAVIAQCAADAIVAVGAAGGVDVPDPKLGTCGPLPAARRAPKHAGSNLLRYLGPAAVALVVLVAATTVAKRRLGRT